jgi:hypothetical protein
VRPELGVAQSPVLSKRLAPKEAFLAACGAAFDRCVPSEGSLPFASMSKIEAEVELQARFLATLLIEKRLAVDPLADAQQEFICPSCGWRLRVQSPHQSRVLTTRMGDVEYERPYTVCDRCDFCAAPLDYAMGIPTRGPTVARRELVGATAADSRSFEHSKRQLARQRIELSSESIRKLAEREGRRIVETRDQDVERVFARSQLPATKVDPPELLIITCDGGMVQTRDAKHRWKSDKVGCVYDATPQPTPQAASAKEYRGAKAVTKTYTASMVTWKDFGGMLYTEARRRGLDEAHQVVFISDAAESIRELRAMHFPQAAGIIDWYHAKEHIHNSAKAAFGTTSDSECWVQEVGDLLWNGQLKDVIAAIKKQSDKKGPPPKGASDSDPRVILHRDVGYFTKNRAEMDYPTYRARGWPIGSGVAEGSVKIFGKRLKGSEKFWNIEGSEEMLALCALYLSEDGRWPEHWKKLEEPVGGTIMTRPLTLSN